ARTCEAGEGCAGVHFGPRGRDQEESRHRGPQAPRQGPRRASDAAAGGGGAMRHDGIGWHPEPSDLPKPDPVREKLEPAQRLIRDAAGVCRVKRLQPKILEVEREIRALMQELPPRPPAAVRCQWRRWGLI